MAFEKRPEKREVVICSGGLSTPGRGTSQDPVAREQRLHRISRRAGRQGGGWGGGVE